LCGSFRAWIPRIADPGAVPLAQRTLWRRGATPAAAMAGGDRRQRRAAPGAAPTCRNA